MQAASCTGAYKRVVPNLVATANKVDKAEAILVQNAAGLGFMHQPSTRSILNQNRGLLRQHNKVGLRVCYIVENRTTLELL